MFYFQQIQHLAWTTKFFILLVWSGCHHIVSIARFLSSLWSMQLCKQYINKIKTTLTSHTNQKGCFASLAPQQLCFILSILAFSMNQCLDNDSYIHTQKIRVYTQCDCAYTLWYFVWPPLTQQKINISINRFWQINKLNVDALFSGRPDVDTEQNLRGGSAPNRWWRHADRASALISPTEKSLQETMWPLPPPSIPGVPQMLLHRGPV